jgi:DNA-binding transcriptional ArsR family regulator
MTEAELVKSIEDLRTEIDGLSHAVLGVRLDDFKKVILVQVQYVITEYYRQFLESNFERIDCISTCNHRKDCRGALNDIFQNISSSFMKDDFDTPLQELDRAESLISGLRSPCQNKQCSTMQLGMVHDIRALVIFAQTMCLKVSGNTPVPTQGPLQDIDEASKMMAPLSHPVRLRILQVLNTRERAFTDLSRDLDLRTGHLQFHLRPLLDEGYVSKVRNRGDYSITTRGKAALDMVSMFSRRLSI